MLALCSRVLLGLLVASVLDARPARSQGWDEPRSVQLSASQGTVDPPPLAALVLTFYRLDIDGPLTIPAPQGDVTPGRRLLFLLRSAVPQPLTFVAEGYAPQNPLYPLPRCTTGGGHTDILLFRYDAVSDVWLLRPPSIAPETPPTEECLAPAAPAGR